MRHDLEVTVTVGDDAVVIRRAGRSQPSVANILGVTMGVDGQPTCIWLDRLVHGPRETTFGEWSVSGAVTSVLSRKESHEL